MHLYGLEQARQSCSACVCVLLVVTLGLFDVVVSTELCERAQANCVHRVGCSAALQNYFFACDDIIHGLTSQCVPRCRKALIALMTTEDEQGQNLMTCDCGNHTMCREQRVRLEICSQEVFQALENLNDDNVDISCSLAQQICDADTSCRAALGWYEHHCTKLFLGEKCTESCNNSLSILYRQLKARKLRTCICDGTHSEKHFCDRVRRHTEHFCLAPRHVRHPGKHDHTRAPQTDVQGKPTYSLKNRTRSSASWNEDNLNVNTGAASGQSWTHSPTVNIVSALTLILTLNLLQPR